MATKSNTQKISEMIENLELVIREAKHYGYKDWESEMELVQLMDPVFTSLAEKLDIDNLDIDANKKINKCFLELLDFYYAVRAIKRPTSYDYRVVNSLYDIVKETYFGN